MLHDLNINPGEFCVPDGAIKSCIGSGILGCESPIVLQLAQFIDLLFNRIGNNSSKEMVVSMMPTQEQYLHHFLIIDAQYGDQRLLVKGFMSTYFSASNA